MVNVTMDTQSKMKFPTLCRELRLAARLKQREVAAGVGLGTRSWGNVESSSHKVLALDRVKEVARYFKLPPDREAELIKAWEELPASEYAARRGAAHERRRAMRSKVRGYEELRASLVELVGVLLAVAPDPAALCACPDPDPFDPEGVKPCELCRALHNLGLPSYSGDTITQLAELQ